MQKDYRTKRSELRLLGFGSFMVTLLCAISGANCFHPPQFGLDGNACTVLGIVLIVFAICSGAGFCYTMQDLEDLESEEMLSNQIEPEASFMQYAPLVDTSLLAYSADDELLDDLEREDTEREFQSITRHFFD